MNPTILIVIPTYNAFEYAARAVRTALAHTNYMRASVLVVDDASPERLANERHKLPHSVDEPYGNFLIYLKDLRYEFGDDRIFQATFDENGGLTRSWNLGLTMAREAAFDFCCVTNSDVMFAPRWDRDIFALLNADKYHLVGPVTNAPGTNQEQYVARYSVLYDPRKKDDVYHIAAVQDELRGAQSLRSKPTTLNGFCLVAKTRTWWDHAYDRDSVFRPRNDFNSKGERNPTPLMTLNEYELQRRWHAAGLRTGVALGSYVYHYRAVSRGDKHRKGDWARINKKEGTA